MTWGRKRRIALTMSLSTASLAPLPERFSWAYRKPKIERSREKLLNSVVFSCSHHLPGANETQCLEQIRPDKILAAFTAGQGQQSCSRMQAAAHVGQDSRVLVVGVGSNKHDPRRIGQAIDSLREANKAMVNRKLLSLSAQT